MSDSTSIISGGSFCLVSVLAVLTGLLVVGYGLLLVPVSMLGGAHIAAIGFSLVLSGLFATEWAGDRWGLSASDRRTLSLSFGVLAALLLIAFVVINFASFESGGVETAVEHIDDGVWPGGVGSALDW